jgi:hypothetical protein
MRAYIISFGFASLLSACGSQPAETSANASGNAAANVANQLASLTEGQRNAVFIRALRDDNQPCQHVDASESLGEYRGFPVWRAHCDNGATNWTIVVTADGTAQIINDAEARLAGLNISDANENGAAPANEAAPAANQQGR